MIYVVFKLNADSGTIEHTIETHSFLSVKSYLCTLSRGYFEFMDCREASSSKIFTLEVSLYDSAYTSDTFQVVANARNHHLK